MMITDYLISSEQLKELMNFLDHCGIADSVVGDPKQSQPISLNCNNSGSDCYYNSYSGIEWIINFITS